MRRVFSKNLRFDDESLQIIFQSNFERFGVWVRTSSFLQGKGKTTDFEKSK